MTARLLRVELLLSSNAARRLIRRCTREPGIIDSSRCALRRELWPRMRLTLSPSVGKPLRTTSMGERRPAFASERPVVMRCTSDASDPCPRRRSRRSSTRWRGSWSCSFAASEHRALACGSCARPAMRRRQARRGRYLQRSAAPSPSSRHLRPCSPGDSAVLGRLSGLATVPRLLVGVERFLGVARLRAVGFCFCALAREPVLWIAGYCSAESRMLTPRCRFVTCLKSSASLSRCWSSWPDAWSAEPFAAFLG